MDQERVWRMDRISRIDDRVAKRYAFYRRNARACSVLFFILMVPYGLMLAVLPGMVEELGAEYVTRILGGVPWMLIGVLGFGFFMRARRDHAVSVLARREAGA